jgi:3',5'-cyclic AMP phosphodiesterase CpdA
VPVRLLHLSDLHVGTVEEPAVERALAALIERADPHLIVASGDLTHRGRREQHERAAAFLKRLARPLLVVPGNHDIPWALPARFTHPFREFER